MPQASDEDRAQMKKWFGDEVSDQGPMAFLASHGFKLGRDWQWTLPVPHHTVSCFEWECIKFLVYEWDFRGIRYDHPGDTVCICGNHDYARTDPATNT